MKGQSFFGRSSKIVSSTYSWYIMILEMYKSNDGSFESVAHLEGLP